MQNINVCLDEEYALLGIEKWIHFNSFFKEGQRFLIVGPSGSGKTVFATTLLGKLALYLQDPIIYIIDPKGIDFTPFENCLHYYAVDNSIQGIENFFQLFEARLHKTTLCKQHAILFVDELSSLIISQPRKEADILKIKIARLLNISRALNISVIVALQRADASLFEYGARDNFNNRLLMGNIALNKESISMIANEDKDLISPCTIGIGYLITDKGIKKIRSVLPRNKIKLYKIISEAVNRNPESGAEQ